jgi:glucose/arabinose dehydrogenase/mono/diheme cytochrome c family protein
MKIKNSIFTDIIIVIIFGATLIFSCAKNIPQEIAEKITLSDSVVARSEKIFKTNCSGCHGAVMMGFVDREWKYGNSSEDLLESITLGRGKGDAAMPAFAKGLSTRQIDEMVSYIRYGIQNLDKYEFEDVDVTGDIFKSGNFSYRLKEVAAGFESVWGMAFLPNGWIIVTDKNGELWRIDKAGKKHEIEDVPEVLYEGQGGLMDVELHPEYEKNGWLYLAYSIFKDGDDETLSTTAVSRYRLKDDKLVDGQLLFEALPYTDTRHHYGTRIEFDNDGYLFITVGDRGARMVNPQDLSLYPGKVHRIYDDGRIPDDNPFVNDENAVASIYSYGHRNQQGMVKHPESGKMWTHEHGPRGGDEINIVQKGLNYGWPVISYGINYSGTTFTLLTEKEGMEQPLLYWVPSIAPCGMDFVTSDLYPAWKGHLLVGSLRFQYVNLVRIDGEKIISEELLMKNIGRVRQVKQGPDGYLYVAVEEPGRIYKIIPK